MSYGTNIYHAERDLRETPKCLTMDCKNGWYIARPTGYIGILHKLKCLWLVATGKADIVVWDLPNNQ